MRFVCENCLAQYMIKDEKVKPQGVKVRCKKCSQIMTVRLPEFDELSDEATIRMPLPEEDDAEGLFEEMLGLPAPANESEGAASAAYASADGLSESSAGMLSSSPPADLGSLFDDPELKPPASGLFGSLDDEELGDAFERAISRPGSASGALAEPSIVVAQGLSQSANVEWFVAIEDNQIGPLDLPGVKSHWLQGKIGRDSLCWKSGMRDWEPIGAVEGLFEQLNMPADAPSMETLSPPSQSASAPDWQPSAASALASLVQDELQGMAASPPPLLGATPGAEAAPAYGVAAAVADIPLPPVSASSTPAPMPGHISFPPAPAYTSNISAAPAPANSSFYLPPVTPPAKTHKAVWLAAGLLVLCGFLVGAVVFMRGASPQPPPPVALPTPAPVPTPPVPPAPEASPPAVVQKKPPVQEEPAQEDASQALAQQLLPPKQPPPAKMTAAERRAGRTPPAAAAAASAPAPAAPPARTAGRAQDDFDKVFGASSEASRPARQERQATVYVPPAPGGGAARQSLSDADIMEFILRKKPEVARCAREQKAKDANVKGNMVVEWTIATSGRTSQVKLASPSSFQGTHFSNCVIHLIQSWQFPAHRAAGGTRKFNFKI